MKKMKLTRSLLAACSIVALTAVMYGCVHDGGDEEPMAEMPEPMPEPDPGPTDLDETQEAAAMAATAAMTASTSAATSASDAMAATATLATLQTGADSNSGMMGGREHASAASYAAKDAAEAAEEAAAASAAAAAATTGPDAEAAWAEARDARDAARAAAALAATHSAMAIAAAMTELHIDDTVKSAGESTVDADADTSISPAGDRVTGFIGNVERALGAVAGQAYDEDAATPTPYIQSVAARSLKIAKTLDTSDDKARLTVFHSRFTTDDVRVYVVNDAATEVMGTVASGGRLQTDGTDTADDATDDTFITLKSIGMHLEAAEPDTPDTTAGAATDNLDHLDSVGEMTKPKELFSYETDAGATVTVVETSRTIDAGSGDVVVTYQPVDHLAPAAPDAHGLADDAVDTLPDTNEDPEQIPVTASIPMANAYSHIHFGIWAGLGPAATDGSQEVADLGIGFVQNFSGSGMTDRLGIGIVSYNGDWVAAVQRRNSTAGAGAISLDNGPATMTADFDEGDFTAMLTGLATLTGSISDDGFSGMTATAIAHDDLDSDGTFAGEFSGGVYGPAGTEAAGVFDFDGGQAGAFRGAFGGTNQD